MRAYQVTSLQHKPLPRCEALDLGDRLDEALAAKLLGVLRARRHHFMARRSGSLHAVDMFLAHSIQEQEHADLLAARIVELEGDPEFAPASLLRGNDVPVFEHGSRVLEMAREDQEATRLAASMLAEILGTLSASDTPTRKLLESIAASDRVKAAELATLIASLDGK